MNLIIFGAGGQGKCIFDLAQVLSIPVIGFVDPRMPTLKLFDIPVVPNCQDLPISSVTKFALGFGDGALREKVATEHAYLGGLEIFPNLVHPSANVSTYAQLGLGNVILANANVGPLVVIGNFVLLNTNSNTNHDSRIDDFVTIAPGVNIGGNTRIGKGSSVGIGAIVKDRVDIGNYSIVGAASYVNKDVLHSEIVIGVPAKVVQSYEPNNSKA